jgi:hypothetical protein
MNTKAKMWLFAPFIDIPRLMVRFVCCDACP